MGSLVVGGCGDDDEEPPKVALAEWAGDVCGAFTDFAGQAAGFVQELGPLEELPVGDLAGTVGLLDAIGQGLGAMQAELAELGAELQASGVPDAEDGEQAAAAVIETFGELRERLQAAVDLVAGLGPGDLGSEGRADFEERLRGIADGLGSLGDDLDEALPEEIRVVLAGQAGCNEADELLTSVEESFVPS